VALPLSSISMSVNDNTLNQKTGKPESAEFQFNVNDITAGNIVATLAAWTTFRSAINAIIIGVERQESVVAYRTTASNTRASSNLAQRENKWLCRYHDATNSLPYKLSIPTADLSLLPDGLEYLDLADGGVGEDFKTAWEALVKSPYDPTHATVLDSVQFVGRNL